MKDVKNLTILFSGFAALCASSDANANIPNNKFNSALKALDNILTTPMLSLRLPSFMAQHRSHASHSSHRSSSGATPTYRPAPTPRAPAPAPAKKKTQAAKQPSDPLGKPPRPTATIPTVEEQKKLSVILTNNQKRKNLIMRLQLTLFALGHYKDPITGIFDDPTIKALNDYRVTKGLKKSKKLDAKTLNALGILIQ